MSYVGIFGIGVLPILLARHFGPKTVRAHLAGVGKVTVRPSDTDIGTFYKVFGEKQYDLSGIPQAELLRRDYEEILGKGKEPIVIDAGANVGAATIWFAKQFPLARIFAVEPEARNAAICRSNIASLSKVTLLEGGIAGKAGKMRIAAVVGGSVGVQGTRTEDETGIDLYSVADIIAMAQPDGSLWLVKIDIEGFEADLFASNASWVGDASAIFIEPHDWLFPGKGTSQSMQKALLGAGFEILIRGENLVFFRNYES